MMTLALIFAAIAIVEGFVIFGGKQVLAEQAEEQQRLWTHVRELEHDKRALTESLCRAEGKPVNLIPIELIPSDGWYDGKPHIVKVTPN